MLNAKAVLAHGMSDSRWTAKEKITQYKGLVSLYKRDKKMIGCDKSAVNKRQQLKCRKLYRTLIANRRTLNRSVKCDQQKIQNCLRVDNKLLLAYQDLTVDNIIEHITQDIFNSRNTLDRLMYKLRMKTKKLINLKLELTLKQDTVIGIEGINALETKSKIVTSKIQDAILKQDAAIGVGVTYREIINYMKKDSSYFDGVLTVLESDLNQQNRGMINAITLGQLATEHLDDIRHQFDRMKCQFKKDTINMKSVFETKMLVIKILRLKIRERTREESQVICSPTSTDVEIQDDLEEMVHLQNIFQKLMETTKTTNVFDIFPCIQKQRAQMLEMEELLKKLSGGKNVLQNKRDRTKFSLDYLFNVMDNQIQKIELESQEVEEDIKRKDKELTKAREQSLTIGNLLARMNLAMTNIEMICDHVKKPTRTKSKLFSTQPLEDTTNMQHNFLHRLNLIYNKVELLVNKVGDMNIDNIKDQCMAMHMELVNTGWKESMWTESIILKQYLESLPIEDKLIPTRESIKNDSINITKANILKTEML